MTSKKNSKFPGSFEISEKCSKISYKCLNMPGKIQNFLKNSPRFPGKRFCIKNPTQIPMAREKNSKFPPNFINFRGMFQNFLQISYTFENTRKHSKFPKTSPNFPGKRVCTTNPAHLGDDGNITYCPQVSAGTVSEKAGIFILTNISRHLVLSSLESHYYVNVRLP